MRLDFEVYSYKTMGIIIKKNLSEAMNISRTGLSVRMALLPGGLCLHGRVVAALWIILVVWVVFMVGVICMLRMLWVILTVWVVFIQTILMM
jgi:hypothetical protein